jgi:hypothetical protein
VPGQFRRRDVAVSEFVAAIEHIRIRHLLLADADPDGGAVFRDEWPQPLQQITAEETRLGDGGGVYAGGLKLAPGSTGRRNRPAWPPLQPKFRIAEALPLIGVRWRTARSEQRQRVALCLHRVGVHPLQPIHRVVGR